RPCASSALAPDPRRRLSIIGGRETMDERGHRKAPMYPVAMRSVLAIILGGGAGSRLFPLTHMRSKPAVPIGGKYRLIDVPISNCLHADIRRIYVLTQFNSASLNRHVNHTYRMDQFSNGFVDIIA